MELNTKIDPGSFVIQIVGLTEHHWAQLTKYGFDKLPLYWTQGGHVYVLAHLVNAPEMQLEFRPIRQHSPEEAHRFVVKRLRGVAEIIRKLELNGIPTRFSWVKEKLPDLEGDVDVDSEVGSSTPLGRRANGE